MRKKLLMLAATVMATLLLTGCMITSTLIGEGKQIHEEIENDEIIAFAEVAKELPTVQKGSLIMQGKKYWFIIRSVPKSNQENIEILHKVLTEPWKEQFQFTDESGLITKDYLELQLPYNVARVGSDSPFEISLCLRYYTVSDNEKTRLKEMGFTVLPDSKAWHRCFEMDGGLYKSPQENIPQQQLRRVLPVKIIAELTEDPKMTPIKAVALPFAMAADVVITIPVMTVFLITHPMSTRW